MTKGSVVLGAWAANRLGLDYHAEADRLGAPPAPFIDAHSHINGYDAARIYGEARRLYGGDLTYSMTQIEEAAGVREVLGDSIRFIAVPSYMSENRLHAMQEGFLEAVHRFHDEFGSHMVKFWAAPRSRDLLGEGAEEEAWIDSEWKVRIAEDAVRLGMMFMVHIADPDTWFATKYADASRYGTKSDQYIRLERMLDRFGVPWIAAHMGGWPEDLGFLDGLLTRHDNLHLDTSATKWMVRELSKHPREALVDFFTKWQGRLLFGSDIVVTEEHLKADEDSSRFGLGATTEQQAFDLYASRYWALRTMFETDYDDESPIADPDLAMVDPDTYDEMSAPRLRGMRLPREVLESLYAGAARSLFARFT